MSTDIVNFQTSNVGSIIELPALRFYLAISLPLVALTLFAWYAAYWWEKRKEKKTHTFAV